MYLFLLLPFFAIALPDTTTPAQPIVTWPVQKGYGRLYSDRVVILDPEFPLLPATRWDAAITYAGKKLQAIDPTTGRDLWAASIDCPLEPRLLGMTEADYIFVTRYTAFAVSRHEGRIDWKFGETPPQDSSEDPEVYTAFTKSFMTADFLFLGSNRKKITCLNLKAGQIEWEAKLNGEIVSIQGYPPRIGVFFRDSDGLAFSSYILSNGTEPFSFSLRSHPVIRYWQVIQHGLSTPENLLMGAGPDALTCVDAENGTTRWEYRVKAHYLLDTFQVDDNTAFITNEANFLSKIGVTKLADWTTEFTRATGTNDVWLGFTRAYVLIVTNRQFITLDKATGKKRFGKRLPSNMRSQSPILLRDQILLVTGCETSMDTEAKPTTQKDAAGCKYQISCWGIEDGKSRPLVDDGVLKTEPLESFGGLFVRDHALLLLDGNRLIGYADATTKHESHSDAKPDTDRDVHGPTVR